MSPLDSKILGRLILANVLEMRIDQYLNYVQRFIFSTSDPPFYKVSYIDERFIKGASRGITAVVVSESGKFWFYSHKYIKLSFEMLWKPNEPGLMHRMNWIRTRNLFFHHVMRSLLTLQRGFWESGNPKKLLPVSLKAFLQEYPYPYLDIYRLSRLINNTRIIFDKEKYLLRDLFQSKKRVRARIVEQVIYQQQGMITDREIQIILKRDYDTDVSIRTVCSYRNLLHIPAYNKVQLCNPYNNLFSMAQSLDRKSLTDIPHNAGVYEISVERKIKCPKFASRVIYFGRSKNLKGRIQDYLYAKIKNPVIQYYRDKQKLKIRYLCTSKYDEIEKQLLRWHREEFDSLPIANRLA